MKLSLELSARMAAAVLSRLLTAKYEHTLDLERQKHYSDVDEFKALLAVALEKDASREKEKPSNAPGSMDGERKKGPGRPPKLAAAPPPLPKVAAKDCKHELYLKRVCVGCGEPEPQTCERGYHLYEGGKCARCGKPEDAPEVKS